MIPRAFETDHTGFPLRAGMLGVSGAVLRGAAETDGCGVIVDEGGSVCVFVVKVTRELDRAGLPAAVAASIGVAAKARLPIYELVREVQRFAVAEGGVSVGLCLVRFSARDSRVEILNAGMPPIIRLLPGTAPALYPSRSGRVGNRLSEVHAYELSPLVWGSSWLLVSDGITGGSLDPVALLRGIAASNLDQTAYELADAEVSRLEAAALALCAAGAAPGIISDRTLLVANADGRRRFASGSEPRG